MAISNENLKPFSPHNKTPALTIFNLQKRKKKILQTFNIMTLPMNNTFLPTKKPKTFCFSCFAVRHSITSVFL